TDEEVEDFKHRWRDAHSNICRLWKQLDVAAWRAVRERDHSIDCGRLAFRCQGMFLFMKLPSGRLLAYPYPRIELEDLEHEVVVFKDNSAGQWRDCRNGNGAYGGLWAENAVSAIARDLLAGAMRRIEKADFPIMMHVHDELVSELSEDR